MQKKFRSIIIFSLLLSLVCYSTVTANPKLEKEAKFSAKVKAEIAKLGIGKNARIKVKLRDKTKVKGYVSETNEDHFVVVNEKNGIATPVAYSNVKQVKGNNLSTETVITIVVVAALIALVAIGWFAKEEH